MTPTSTTDVTSLAPNDPRSSPPPAPSSPLASPQGGVAPQACGCDTGVVAGFVYSAGRLDLRFPDVGDRKEFEARARELGVAPTAYYTVLSTYRYLARRMCWVLTVNEQPAGILVPSGEAELTELVTALQSPWPNLEIAVTGTLGNTAPASTCDGLSVPLVPLTELSYFTESALIDQLVKQTGLDRSALESAAQSIWQLTGVWREPGFDDEQRAENYVVLRTTSLYELTVKLAGDPRNPFWLQTITSRATRTEAGRSVVNVDSAFQAASGQTQTWRAEIDVTDLFPFQTKALFQI